MCLEFLESCYKIYINRKNNKEQIKLRKYTYNKLGYKKCINILIYY